MHNFQQFFEKQSLLNGVQQSNNRCKSREEEESRRLDPKCWKGITKKVPNLKTVKESITV